MVITTNIFLVDTENFIIMWEMARTLEKFMFDLYVMRKFKNISVRYCSAAIENNMIKLQNSHVPSDLKNTKILKVAIIGAPNAGKSTIINQIVNRRIFAISKKVHTTKVCARAILNDGNKQVVFLDTPGLVSYKEFERYKLGNSFLSGGEDAVIEADLIGVIHDISNSSGRYSLDPKVLRLLNIYKNKESVLILNKVDTLKSKGHLLDLSAKLTGGKLKCGDQEKKCKESLSETQLQNIVKTQRHWENFSEVFMVSALLGDGTGKLRNYLLNRSYPGQWIFPADTYTDQNPLRIIEEAVRSKLLEHLPEEIPYNVDVQLEYLDMDKEELISAVVLIYCNSNRIAGLIKGVKGGRIKIIADEAEQAVADAFLTDVHLKLVITEKRVEKALC